MSRRRTVPAAADSHGAALVTVLAFVAAGMVLAAATARTGALELAMADRGANRLRAIEAAEAGLAHALRSRGWSAAGPWTDAGELPGDARWTVEARLAAARLDPASGMVEWHFEILGTGRAGTAQYSMAQGFVVTGALPGEPRLTWWRHAEPAP